MALQKVRGNLERMFDKNMNDLVRGIRNNKDNESKYIAQCLEEIKQELRQYNLSVKANAILKLTYLQMCGYDISWAAFNIIEVMSSTKFTEKRIGYLAASQCFHQDTEVLMLSTNMIRKDLSATGMYEAGVTLSSLACFMSPDLARDLTNDVMTLLTSTKPYVRKKAVLLLYKIFLRYPEALRAAFPRLKERLEDPDPGVQSAAVNVICELARKNPKNYLSLAPTFFKLMTSSTNNWMLIKIIKLFGALTPLEPRLGKKLIEPLTNLIHSTSAMSLLYECINTVIAVLISISSGMPNHAASVQLCVQKLRILIEDSDQNLKYLGLLAMSKILKTNPKSVSGHKDLVLGCLEDLDESIRLRALDLLSWMVTKKNLMEIVKKLMQHMEKAEGTTYRDELLAKIIQICSQNDYQHISNFEWYVSVLVELSQMEGGGHGALLAKQMMDVSIRVQAIRPFAVQQMALLVENSAVLLGTGRRNNAAEVLYAAGWVIGEFGEHLPQPGEALQAMLRGLGPDLPGHIQAVYIQNSLKLYSRIAATGEVEELNTNMIKKMELLVCSSHLEVQERASVGLQMIKYMEKQRDKGENVTEELAACFAGELNPVAAKAQKKVPIPEGLDLDAWINPVPELSDTDEEEEEEKGGQVFFREEEKELKRNIPEPTSEEKAATRQARLQEQSTNPYYLKDTPKSSPARSNRSRQSIDIEEIPIQAIDLGVPLHIPGLAASDQYFNLSQNNSGRSSQNEKKKKKKKRSKKKTESSSEEETGPNCQVSTNIEMPEGVDISDGEEDVRDINDPHRALADISLEDDIPPVVSQKEKKKEKRSKKKKKEYGDMSDLIDVGETNGATNDVDLWQENTDQHEIVERLAEKPKKKEKKKKDKKAKKSKRKNVEDLLGLEPSLPAVSTCRVVASDKCLQLQYDPNSCQLSEEAAVVDLQLLNTGDFQLSDVTLQLCNVDDGSIQITEVMTPAAVLTKQLQSLPTAVDAKHQVSGSVSYSHGTPAVTDVLQFHLSIPVSASIVSNSITTEGLAQLLIAGQLPHQSTRQLVVPAVTSLPSLLARISAQMRLSVVETDTGSASASLYGRTANDIQVALLVKLSEGQVHVDGRSDGPGLVDSVLDEVVEVVIGQDN